MATQGIVSLLNNGEMFFKAVAGSNGFNASKLVDWAQAHEGVMTIEDVYKAAIEVKFGALADLVVQASDGSCIYDGNEIEDVDRLYFDHPKFLDPRFNPRWEQGTAEYVEVVNLTA
jgi:hypothetical protein